MIKKKQFSDLCNRKRTSVSKAINRGRESNCSSSVKIYKHKHSEEELNLSISYDSDSSTSNKSWVTISSDESASTTTTPDDLTREQALYRTSESPISLLNDSTNASGLQTKEPVLNLSISCLSECSTWHHVWPSFTSDDYESASTSTTSNDFTRDTKWWKNSETSNIPSNDSISLSGLNTKVKIPRKQKFSKNHLQKSPKNDLTNVRGVKKIFQTPKPHKSPNNDLSDVRGVKNIFQTPKPHKSPNNDLSDVGGVKKIFQTPIPHKSPKNDLSDVRGLEEIFKTPKNYPKFHDGDISKQKLLALIQKGKINCSQVTANVNNSNLKNPRPVEVSPKQHDRIREKSAELKEDNPEKVMEKKSRHGRQKLDETVEKEETGVRQKRNLSSRRKNIVEENKGTIHTSRKCIGNGEAIKNTDGSDNKQSGIEAQKGNSSSDHKEVEDISKKRELPSRRKGVFEEGKETLESTVEKRSVPCRTKKIIEETTSGERIRLPNDRNLHAQRKENMDEKSLEASESSEKSGRRKAEAGEHVDYCQRRYNTRRAAKGKAGENPNDQRRYNTLRAGNAEAGENVNGQRRYYTRKVAKEEAEDNVNSKTRYNTRGAGKKS